jgi:asparagine synthase (glutamine-hydrolysing)
MKALWAAGIQRKANLQMLFNYITIGYVDNPERPEETFFENIFKLPPASRLYYKPATGELTIEKYWEIDTASGTKLSGCRSNRAISAPFFNFRKKKVEE